MESCNGCSSIECDLCRSLMWATLDLKKRNGRPPSLRELTDEVQTPQCSRRQIHDRLEALIGTGFIEKVTPASAPGRHATRYQVATE